MFNVSSITNSNASQMAANIAVSASSKLTTIFHATVKPAAYAAVSLIRNNIVVIGFAVLIAVVIYRNLFKSRINDNFSAKICCTQIAQDLRTRQFRMEGAKCEKQLEELRKKPYKSPHDELMIKELMESIRVLSKKICEIEYRELN